MTVSNVAFQYRKGLFNIEAYKVVFQDVKFTNIQHYTDKFTYFKILNSASTLSEIVANYL